jgi:phage-related holin
MSVAFMCSYFMELTMDNADQYLAIMALIFADGFFGVIAGVKKEGFKTYKALKILRTFAYWIIILTVVLAIEKSFEGVNWLSETIITPLIILQLISALKNASMAGFVKMEELNRLLDRIDKHKGERE